MAKSASRSRSAGGGVDWRRFAAIAAPALIAAVALVALTTQGVLAVSFSISGTPFTVTARQLKGQGFEQFGVLDRSARQASSGHTNQIGLTANVIKSATISHLCQSVALGPLTLRITAGTGSTPVQATDLVVDADRLSGNASFTNISIGQDAGTLTAVPGIKGPPGEFAQQASTVVIRNLRQHAYATTAGTFTLPDFSLSFGHAC